MGFFKEIIFLPLDKSKDKRSNSFIGGPSSFTIEDIDVGDCVSGYDYDVRGIIRGRIETILYHTNIYFNKYTLYTGEVLQGFEIEKLWKRRFI